MAIHKSEIKRALQNIDRNNRNKAVKSAVKNVIKTVHRSVAEKPKDEVMKDLKHAQATIAKASKKRVVHKKAAARKISRLAKFVNRSEAR